MFVLVQSSHWCEILLEIPDLDFSIIRRRDYVRLSWMYDDSSDEICVSFNSFYLFHVVVIENSKLEIIRTADDPILLRDEFDCSDGKSRSLQCSNAGLDYYLENTLLG